MSRKQYIDKKKGTAESGNFQLSLFDNSVVEHTASDRPSVPHFTRRQKRKRRKRRTMENINVREIKGQQIAETVELKKYKGRQIVPSQTRPHKSYKVNPTTLECNCLDFTFNGQTCKHIYAVLFKQGREKLDPLRKFPKSATHKIGEPTTKARPRRKRNS